MSGDYYPEIDAGALMPIRCVFQEMRNDPLWLERRGCPYDSETIEALKELFVQVRAPRETAADDEDDDALEGSDKWDSIDKELTSLFKELRNYAKDLDKEQDQKDKMAYFRTATSLLDKITSIGERVQNVKAVSDYTSRVLVVFDEILNPEQRTLAIAKLGNGAGA
jgi:hypothetical protein